MPQSFVVAEADVEGRRAEGDTALEKLVHGAHTGSGLLEQRVTRYAPGRSLPRTEADRDELLYVVSGSGTLELDGEPYDLEPESGVYVRAGETLRGRQRTARTSCWSSPPASRSRASSGRRGR